MTQPDPFFSALGRGGYQFGCTWGVAGCFELSSERPLQRLDGDLTAAHGLRVVGKRHRRVRVAWWPPRPKRWLKFVVSAPDKDGAWRSKAAG